MIFLLTVVVGCGSDPQFGPGATPDRAGVLAGMGALPPNQLWFLEQAGVSAPDTVVTFARSEGRTVVIRHRPPDNAIYAMVSIPADTTATDSATLELQPAPGRYGLTIAASQAIPPGMQVSFSYAIHFQAPSGAADAYLSAARFEEWLGIAQVLPNGNLRFLPNSTRPAADMVRAPITTSGQYLVVAPRARPQ